MDTTFTDKYIKNNLESIEFESEDFKSTEFNNGVYNSILKLKILNETGKANVLASANFFIVNGETTDIVDAADSESGDLYFVAESMVNYFKINQYSSIAILDNYSLFSSKATVVSKKMLFEEYILPYFKDRRIDYIAFCNASFEFTDNKIKQQFLDELFDDMTVINNKKAINDDWKSTVNLIDMNYTAELEAAPYLEDDEISKVNTSELTIDPFIEEYKIETGKKLPKEFEAEYEKYIFNDEQQLSNSMKECIINVYKFKKNIYYSEDGRRITVTNEDRKEMNNFLDIKRSFENIEELYNRVTYSYKNLISGFLLTDTATNSNVTVGAFLSDGNMFIDYLDQKWLTQYIPEFKNSWKKLCAYTYDNNLGYRLCYNLRNFDQHPRNHEASPIISETVEKIDENRVEYYLNMSGLYNDRQIRNKMEKDFSYLQSNENNEFSKYARNYMINLTLLYNLALTHFFTKNIEKIKNVYTYLSRHNFDRVMIKSVDNRNKKIIGTDYANDVISTLDIDNFLHCFESKGIINEQNILDIRNGRSDTPNSYLTPTQILKNVIKKRFLYTE
jgi:hypothetical protein